MCSFSGNKKITLLTIMVIMKHVKKNIKLNKITHVEKSKISVTKSATNDIATNKSLQITQRNIVL